MPFVRSLRDVTVRSTSGHTVAVCAGKVTFMPPAVLPDAITLGCVECDEHGDLNIPQSIKQLPVTEVPRLQESDRDNMDARAAAIVQAVAQIYQENDQSKFAKTTKLPRTMYVVELTGFPTSPDEIRAAVETYHASLK